VTRGARIVRALSVAFVALQSVACGTAGSPSASLAGVALPSLPAGSSWLAFALDADGGWDFDGGDADIYLVDDRGDHRIRLTDDPANDYSPEWSPDGRTIAFRTNRDGNHEIYAMDWNGANPRNLTRDRGEQRSPAFSPDGRTIAYASAGEDGFDIWLMDADGGNPRRLAGHGLDEYPTFSPDGSRIAFTSYCSGCGSAALVVMDVDGSDRRELAPEAGWPDWSLDVRKLAFDAAVGGRVLTFVVDPEGQPPRPARIAEGVQLDWSPDGSRIAFTVIPERPTSGFPCCADIVVAAADGSEAVTLTDDLEGFAIEPTWRP
jgi:Tol biopolymer transport system component